jgi:hypothetical protein
MKNILILLFILSSFFCQSQPLLTQYNEGKTRVGDSIGYYVTGNGRYIDKITTAGCYWNLWDFTLNVYDSLKLNSVGIPLSQLNDSLFYYTPKYIFNDSLSNYLPLWLAEVLYQPIGDYIELSQLNDSLGNYLPIWLASLLYQPIGNYLSSSDTVSLSNRIDLKFNTLDTLGKWQYNLGFLPYNQTQVNTLVNLRKLNSDSILSTGYTTLYRNDTGNANNREYTAASVSVLVPYFGATSQVNLGQYNIRANNHFDSSMITVSAGTTTTLTIASPRNQAISGSLSQTFLLPDATTMPKGPSFSFNNNSSGSLIIANTGGTTLYTVPAGGLVQGGATNTATANGAWDFHAIAPTTVTWGSGATGLVFNSVLSTTPSIDAGASSSTNPSFRPQRGSTTTGYGGDGSNLYMILGGASKFSVNSSGHTTVEGVTSTGATGTGNIVYSISPALTGSPTAPTQTAGTSNTTIATTAFVATGFAVANTDTTISANYTLTALDNRRTIHCTNGSNINVTIPTGLAVTFKCDVFQEGAGNVVFVASGTTLNFVPNATTKTLKLGAGVYIGSFATANTFTVQGALQP